VTISDPTTCAKVYYTTDGSTPTTASPVYGSPVSISKTSTLQAIAVCPGGNPSPVKSATYTMTSAGAVTPAFSTGTGTYYAPVTVTITNYTTGATVYYTTDGSTPTTASSVYSGPVTISKTATLQAIAATSGGSPSAVKSATFTVSAPNTPSFSTGTGTYYTPVTVTISEATSCAKVYYTTDGSTPTTASPVYSSPVTISQTAKLQAIAVCPGGSPSAVNSATYTVSAPYAPSFSTGTGTYYTPVTVTISEATSCAKVYYTTDGSTPTTTSAVYSSPVAISKTTTLSAMAQCPGGGPSTVTVNTYTLNSPAVPVLSVASGTYSKSVQVTISEATSSAVVYYTTNGQTPTTSSAVYKAPLTLSNTSTFSTTINLQAIAVVPSGFSSSVASASYTILSTTTPVHGQNSGASFFGLESIGVTNTTPWPQMTFGGLRLLSSQWSWSALNPSRGTYKWTNLDSAIQKAQSNNVAIMYSFISTPPWSIPTGVAITSISRSNGVVTLTTASPHGMYYTPQYAAADQSSITVAGVSDNSFNGTFVLTGTPSATTLTYAQSGANGASSSGTLSSTCSGTSAPGGCAEAPANMSDWDNYVTALVNHVGPGVIRYWEVWNEANIADQWRGNPAVLVTMASHARNIIKAADPNAIVLSPSVTALFETPQLCATSDPRCGSTWMANWLSAGGANAVDAIAFHGYPAIGTTPEQIQGGVTLLQQSMNQNGAGSMALYDTESSWGLQTALPNSSDQVAFVGRHLLLEHSMGIQATFWYAYDNANWGSLWSASTGMNPAGDAYEQTRRWLTGATVTSACAATAADSATYSCGYSRPNGYSALAVWSTNGNKTFAAPAGFVQYRDLGGNIIPISGGTVPITAAPILLESGSAF
jgi:hypothetical protein